MRLRRDGQSAQKGLNVHPVVPASTHQPAVLQKGSRAVWDWGFYTLYHMTINGGIGKCVCVCKDAEGSGKKQKDLSFCLMFIFVTWGGEAEEVVLGLVGSAGLDGSREQQRKHQEFILRENADGYLWLATWQGHASPPRSAWFSTCWSNTPVPASVVAGHSNTGEKWVCVWRLDAGLIPVMLTSPRPPASFSSLPSLYCSQ